MINTFIESTQLTVNWLLIGSEAASLRKMNKLLRLSIEQWIILIRMNRWLIVLNLISKYPKEWKKKRRKNKSAVSMKLRKILIFIETSIQFVSIILLIRFDLIECLFIWILNIGYEIELCVLMEFLNCTFFLIDMKTTREREKKCVELSYWIVVWPWAAISVNLQLMFCASFSV